MGNGKRRQITQPGRLAKRVISKSPTNELSARPKLASKHNVIKSDDADPATTVVAAAVKFPLCDAVVRKREGSEWEFADAILAECSEPGANGVKNESYAKIEAMRGEIAKNHGVDLSFERIRKLRKVAAAFPPGRRRPGVSVEGHLEAGTTDALDELINSAPKGTVLTREYIRCSKHPDEKTQKDEQNAERRRQAEDHQKALQDVCRQLEQQNEQLLQRNADLCRTNGEEPEPFSPPLAPDVQPSLNVAEDLKRGLRVLLRSRGFDPTADNIKHAIADFVKAILGKQP